LIDNAANAENVGQSNRGIAVTYFCVEREIYATKSEKRREFSYLIVAAPRTSGTGYSVQYEMGQHGARTGTVKGHQRRDYRRDIHRVTKEDFLATLKRGIAMSGHRVRQSQLSTPVDPFGI
jgi:hypothetical protein